MPTNLLLALSCLLLACGNGSGNGNGSDGGGGGGGPPVTLGDQHAGQYNLGPVEFHGSIPNSCAPYPSEISTAAGDLLVGVGLDFNGHGQLCDACITIDTARGKSLVARVVTTGQTNAPNDVDVSPAAWAALNQGEYPRDMTWSIAKCPDTGKIEYQFQTGANIYWSSLWVRNIRLPLAKVEVKSANHADFAALTRGDDGTYTDASGFGAGGFTLRVTSLDGQTVTDSYPSFTPGGLLSSAGQFQ